MARIPGSSLDVSMAGNVVDVNKFKFDGIRFDPAGMMMIQLESCLIYLNGHISMRLACLRLGAHLSLIKMLLPHNDDDDVLACSLGASLILISSPHNFLNKFIHHQKN
jgi:hypothetical protein